MMGSALEKPICERIRPAYGIRLIACEDKMDKIIIKNLEIFARHGVLPEENAIGQRFFVSCEMSLDLRKAGKTDAMEDSVSYADIAHLIKKTMEERMRRMSLSGMSH